jgi:hypothetical protein
VPPLHHPIQVLISNYEIPAADQGLFPDPPVLDNVFAIPGTGTFTLLPRREIQRGDSCTSRRRDRRQGSSS